MTYRCVTGFLAIIGLTRLAYAAGVEDAPWTKAGFAALQALDQEAIERFVNEQSGDDVQRVKVGESLWTDVAGNGTYCLVVTADTTSRSFFDALYIYRRDGRDGLGKVQVQSIFGVEIRDLPGVVRDLNGDGKKELIVPSRLDAQGPGGAMWPTVTWPKVYRLQSNGNYVDASRAFPGFYDSEVIPGLIKAIDESQQRVAAQPEPRMPPAEDPMYVQHEAEACLPRRQLASLEMTRDKILRVLGRDPEAGLSDAREWVAKADPCLVGNAAVVLADIGGHEDERRAAEDAQKATLRRVRKHD